MRSPGWTLHPSLEICRAKTARAGADRNSPDASAALMSDVSSSSRHASGPHAAARNSARKLAGCSTAAVNSRSSRFQRSVGMEAGQLSIQPRARERPVRVHRALRDAECPRRFLDRETAEETKLDDLCLAWILEG